MMIEEIAQSIGLREGSSLRKAIKDPLYQGLILTLIILILGGVFYNLKSREWIRLKKEEAVTRDLLSQKEKSLVNLRDEARKINSRLQKRSLSDGHLTANERKMSSVLEKMALSAAGRTVEMVSFRPESVVEEEKENLLTVKVKVKSHFNELKEYISRLTHYRNPVKIDWVEIETLENETPMINAELLVMTRIMKEKDEK